MGYIYYCKNLINNKGYVGQTCRTLEERKREHLRHLDGEKVIFHSALLKYGTNNFEWTVLEECENSALNEREIFWIKEKNTHFKDGYGYNMNYGGNNHFATDATSKAIKAISLKDKTEFHFSSIHEAARELSKSEQKIFDVARISSICHGKYGSYSHHDYTFCFLEEGKEIETNFKGDITRKRKGFNILAINEKGEIQNFKSLRQAQEALKIERHTIKKYLDSGKPFKGYLFKYAD